MMVEKRLPVMSVTILLHSPPVMPVETQEILAHQLHGHIITQVKTIIMMINLIIIKLTFKE